MKKHIFYTSLLLMMLSGCSNFNLGLDKPIEEPTPAEDVENVEVVENAICPRAFIGSEMDLPSSDKYNIVFLASTSTKGYAQRFLDLQEAASQAEKSNPELHQTKANEHIRDILFKSKDKSLAAKQIISDLVVVSYFHQMDAKELIKFPECNYAQSMNTVIYFKELFGTNGLTISNTLITSNDKHLTDL